ncbi:MAG TPA: redoxin domain-containing protein [Candidatus Limnocylindrales bacterium]|nr:redoxin domain-containing protein [Candidatus Limnocylindrales bacterium]
MSPTASQTGLQVRIGDPMPSVGLRATDGYLLNLRTFADKRPSIVIFFGGPSLRGAARERGDAMAIMLRDSYARLERAGVGLVAVTTDSEAQQAAYVEKLELPFLLFCDERRTACAMLGIPTRDDRGNINAEPTAFAVGRDGTILDIVERADPKGLMARLLEAINPPE